MSEYLNRPESSDDRVNDIFGKIERGLRKRSVEEKRWLYNEKFEDLYQWGGEDLVRGVEDEVTVNKIASYIRNYRAEICYNDPRVKYTPKHPSGWEPIKVPVLGQDGRPKRGPDGKPEFREIVRAKARESLVNSILSAPEQNLQQTSGLFTKSGIIAHGILKAAYEPVYSTAPEPDKEQYIQRKDGKLDLEPFAKTEDGALVEGEDKPLVEKNDIPVWEQFTVKWVSYKSMIIDPDGGPYWDDHSWVCEEEIRSFEEVKNDPLYENTEDLKSSGRRISDFPEDKSDPVGSRYSAGSDPEGEEDEVSRLFHFFDLDEEKYYLLCDGGTKFLREVTWQEMGIVDHPYEDFRPTLGTDGEWYQRPIICDLIPLAMAYNVLAMALIRAGQQTTRKVFAEEGALDDDAIAALMSTQDLAVVNVKCKKGELHSKVLPYIPPPASPTLLQAIERVSRDFDEIGGMSGEAQGVSRSDSATEANIIESYNRGRIGHDRKILSSSWERLLKKLDDLVDRHMTQPRAVQIQGEDGLLFTAIIDPKEIKGDYEVGVDFQDLAPPNTAQQSAAKMQLLRIFSENPRMASDEAVVRELCEPHQIKSENFIKGIVRKANEEIQFERQMAMAAARAKSQKQMKRPTDAPDNEGQALAQTGGGQVPRGQRPA